MSSRPPLHLEELIPSSTKGKYTIHCCAYVDPYGAKAPGWAVYFPSEHRHLCAAGQLPESLNLNVQCPHRASLYAVLKAIQIAKEVIDCSKEHVTIYACPYARDVIIGVIHPYRCKNWVGMGVRGYGRFLRDIDIMVDILRFINGMTVFVEPLLTLEKGATDKNPWGRLAKSGLESIKEPTFEDGRMVFPGGLPIELLPKDYQLDVAAHQLHHEIGKHAFEGEIHCCEAARHREAHGFHDAVLRCLEGPSCGQARGYPSDPRQSSRSSSASDHLGGPSSGRTSMSSSPSSHMRAGSSGSSRTSLSSSPSNYVDGSSSGSGRARLSSSPSNYVHACSSGLDRPHLCSPPWSRGRGRLTTSNHIRQPRRASSQEVSPASNRELYPQSGPPDLPSRTPIALCTSSRELSPPTRDERNHGFSKAPESNNLTLPDLILYNVAEAGRGNAATKALGGKHVERNKRSATIQRRRGGEGVLA